MSTDLTDLTLHQYFTVMKIKIQMNYGCVVLLFHDDIKRAVSFYEFFFFLGGWGVGGEGCLVFLCGCGCGLVVHRRFYSDSFGITFTILQGQ